MGAYGPTTIDIDKFFRSIKGSKTEKRLRKDIKKDERTLLTYLSALEAKKQFEEAEESLNYAQEVV